MYALPRMVGEVVRLCPLASRAGAIITVSLIDAPRAGLRARGVALYRDGKVFGKLFRPCIDTAFFWQDRHCYQAYLAEVHRRQLSGSFR